MSADLRPLHLHTIQTLCAELISGRAIGVGKENASFRLSSNEARSILNWYSRNRQKWSGNVMAADVEAIIDSIAVVP